ncbi:hypothetical protein CU254_41125 (plasmid) [Amycolatopsis sp. AA4]|uniref:hypothetical protein n=1 Tax=Actinomycetes TaxID=1760 RepID=UPI0001B56168|nr:MULTISPECIES: hypothetical protein [Actinomycetes]ATY16996.1 hypothetical protein CU254_41125 [Amycolatopsis sp. AA4]EFL12515.1 predicted protein [Streptomyces sp. AA4]
MRPIEPLPDEVRAVLTNWLSEGPDEPVEPYDQLPEREKSYILASRALVSLLVEEDQGGRAGERARDLVKKLLESNGREAARTLVRYVLDDAGLSPRPPSGADA